MPKYYNNYTMVDDSFGPGYADRNCYKVYGYYKYHNSIKATKEFIGHYYDGKLHVVSDLELMHYTKLISRFCKNHGKCSINICVYVEHECCKMEAKHVAK